METLGSATVICSDKTGTLTENRMSVSQLYSSGRLYRWSGREFQVQEQEGWLKVGAKSSGPLSFTLSAAALCTNVYEDRGSLQGDPTEVALVEAARRAGLKVSGRDPQRIREFPFSSERKMMSVIRQEGHYRFLLLKGAPELGPGALQPIRAGEKVIALNGSAAPGAARAGGAHGFFRPAPSPWPTGSCRPGSIARREAEKELIWAGLVGLATAPSRGAAGDPPCRRPDPVVMITGDHRATAEAIARRLEILQAATCS